MPFEFTGTPPALIKDAPGTFSSFAQHSASQASSTSMTSSQTPLKSPSAFNSLRSSFSNPSFQHGAPILTTPGSNQSKITKLPVAGAHRHNDPVSRALLRAAEERPANFGHAEVGADAVLKAYMLSQEARQLCNGEDELISQLSAEYAAVAKEYPVVAKLLQFAFGTAAQVGSNIPGKSATNESQGPDLIKGIEPNSALYEALQDRLIDLVFDKVFNLDLAEEDLEELVETVLKSLLSDTTVKALEANLIEGFSRKGCDEAGLKKLAAWVGEKVYEYRKDDDTDDMTRLFLPHSKYEEKQAKELATSARNSDWYAIRHHTYESTNEKPCCDKPEVTSPPIQEGTEESSTPFRLMDLPAELRTWVYRATLCPTGAVSLRSCDHHLPFGTTPVLGVGLLATCKQVHDEVKDLLFLNTIIVNAMIAGSTTRPALHRGQLPDYMASRATSLVIVVDCAMRHPDQRIDWKPLNKMTSLKSLRICAYESEHNRYSVEAWNLMLDDMFAILPQSCAIGYGTQAGTAEREHFDDAIERRNKYIAERTSGFYGPAVEVPKETLGEAHNLTYAEGSTGRKMQ